ncbi:MAG: DUF134 domain-containing protein [Candidatus Methanofastidiosia archaeon]
MPRPRKHRFIEIEPDIVYFKPQGTPLSKIKEIALPLDEFECIRLGDYLKMNQNDAAKMMGIHQSTFQRTLAKAREKIADCLVNGKAIKIEGGRYIMMGRGRQSGSGAGRGAGRGLGFGGPDNCKCPKCGHEVPHQRGIPCIQTKCPECGTMMIGSFRA